MTRQKTFLCLVITWQIEQGKRCTWTIKQRIYQTISPLRAHLFNTKTMNVVFSMSLKITTNSDRSAMYILPYSFSQRNTFSYEYNSYQFLVVLA